MENKKKIKYNQMKARHKRIKPIIKNRVPIRYLITLEKIRGILEFLWTLEPKKANTAVLAIRSLKTNDKNPNNKNRIPTINSNQLTIITT